MSETTHKKPNWLRRIFWGLSAFTIVLVIIVWCLRIFITTDSGARLIETQINKRSFGAIERIEISGLSGDPLRSFKVESVKLYDLSGHWLTLKSAEIEWRPLSLRRKIIDIHSLKIDMAQVDRKPALNSASPASVSSDKPYALKLETATIDKFSLGEAVIGQTAEFALEGNLNKNKDESIKARLVAERTDLAGDELLIDFSRDTAGVIDGLFELNSSSGGALATLLRAPDGANATGTGQLKGNIDSGGGDLRIRFDDEIVVNADGNWTKDAANLKANVDTEDWAFFDEVRDIVGRDVRITAALNRQISPIGFKTLIVSDLIEASAAGQLSVDGGLPDAADVSVKIKNLHAAAPIAEPFEFSAAQLKGRIETAPRNLFTGGIDIKNIVTPYGKAASLTGPVSLFEDAKDQYRTDITLSALGLRSDIDTPFEFSSKTNLSLKAAINTQTTQVNKITAALSTGPNRLSFSGNANYGSNSFDLKGKTALTLGSVGALPAGLLQSDFLLNKKRDTLANLAVTGGFKPLTVGEAPLDKFLKGGANFDVDLSQIENGVDIRKFTLVAESIRGAVSGRISDEIDIDAELMLPSAFEYTSVVLAEETAASFTVSGNRNAPNIRLDARTNKAAVNGYTLTDARLRADLVDILTAPKGPLRFTAETDQGGLDLSTDFESTEQTYIAKNISLNWGILSMLGDISKPLTSPATGQLSLNLPQQDGQYAKANLNLTANGNIQGINLTAEAQNIAVKDMFFDNFTAKASGDLSSLTGEIAAAGHRQLEVLEREFDLQTPFTLSRTEDRTYAAFASPAAKYGNIIMETSSPISLAYKKDDLEIKVPLILADAPVDIAYALKSGTESFTLFAENLPISLLPMPGNLADTRGRIGANISLSASKDQSGVMGEGKISLIDWRGFQVEKGSGLTGDFDVNLKRTQLDWKLAAQSLSGFSATGTGQLPIRNETSLATLRPDMQSRLSGNFAASGEAAAILGLVTPSDAKPSGKLKMEIELSGTASSPNIEGFASGQALRMEAPDLGTQIRNGRFTAQFTNDTLNVSDVSLTDNDNGTIMGQGQFKLGEFARPIGELNMTADKFRALDRKDYEGTVSGQLDVKSTQKQITIGGDVTLNRAEVKQFVSGNASVITIPVEEINAPKSREIKTITPPSLPVVLDVKIRAPRRIFVRSRGLDVELSIDASVKGTLAAPEIYGDATVLRGGYKIAGKELAFQEGGIKFSGALENAQVNLTANTETQNLTAKVAITGTVAKPEVTLSSTPERPQDEILSALLFGRSATELSTIEAAQLAGALAQFSGAGGGFDLLGGLRNALGVGQLSIGVSEDGTAQITGGRYLAKNVYLQIFSGGGTERSGAVIDWEIRKNVSLTSQIQADNEQSFSLKWKRDF